MAEDKSNTPNISPLRAKLAEQVERQQKVSKVLWITLLITTFLAVMYYTGDPLGIYRLVGISPHTVRPGGLYVDCRDPRNKNSPFCAPKKTEIDKEWESIQKTKGKGAKFTLY
ncbi:MAG: hypothetical protein D6780_08230 [Candidatus Dadabacteria bacterium]|nr:MAG: hypothetical protein D6780_08230 [Candidatus Dadabacteria bacterium]